MVETTPDAVVDNDLTSRCRINKEVLGLSMCLKMSAVVDRVLSFVDTEQLPSTARRLVRGPSCAMGALAY